MKKVCDEVSDEFGRKKPNERSFVGRLGKLGLKINGGRDRPCVPGDPGIFITTVKRGSVFDKILGPGDKILKVTVVCARVLRVYQYIIHLETKETEAGQANPRHSHDHSHDPSWYSISISASERAEGKTSSLSYYWPFLESLLWLPSALFACTLLYPRSDCCCRLLLVLLITTTINQWLCAIRNTGQGLEPDRV